MIPQVMPVFSVDTYWFYNCSLVHEPGPWWTEYHGKSSYALAIWSITFGTTALVLYVPCLKALLVERKSACYKIMIWLGLVDIIALYVNAVSFGALLIKGYVYCSDPTYIWITGCLGLGAWCGESIGCLMLVMNRIAEQLNYGTYINKKTKYILILMTVYMLFFMIFTPPVLMNAPQKAMFFDPFITKDEETFVSWLHTINNILVVLTSTLFYFALCVVLTIRNASLSAMQSATQSWAKIFRSQAIFIQATMICIFNVVASLIYVYMNFFEAPIAFTEIGQICWQLSHGSPPFIYLTLNRTIRGHIRKMIRKPTSISTSSRTFTSQRTVQITF